MHLEKQLRFELIVFVFLYEATPPFCSMFTVRVYLETRNIRQLAACYVLKKKNDTTSCCFCAIFFVSRFVFLETARRPKRVVENKGCKRFTNERREFKFIFLKKLRRTMRARAFVIV